MSGISILAYIILALSISYAFIYPSMGDISKLMDEKQKYEDTLEMISNVEIKKQELLTEFNNIPADDKKDIDTILPNSPNFVRLISQIDAVAAKYGISIDKITSKETSPAGGPSIAEAEPLKAYQSSTIGFSFTAPYENFKLFMDDLEKSLRIMDIKTVKLDTGEKGIYTYNVEFETYWLKSLQ